MSNCTPVAHWQVWLFCRPRTRNWNVLNPLRQVRIAGRTVADQLGVVGCRRRHAQTVIVFSVASCQRRRSSCSCRRRDSCVSSSRGSRRWRRQLLRTSYDGHDALSVFADATESADVAWNKRVKYLKQKGRSFKTSTFLFQIFDPFVSGNIRRFRRICEHAQSVVSVVRRPQQLPPSSPRAARRTYTAVTSTTAATASTSLTAGDGKDNNSLSVPSSTPNNAELISDSSSCNSDLSERIQYIPIPGPGSAEKSNLSVGDRGAIRHQVKI